jgi:hypothetical protein
MEARGESIVGSSGAATAGVERVTGSVEGRPVTMIRKTFRPVSGGRHAVAARDPAHWAYWRRELLAYRSGLLPHGPHLAAPHCFRADDDAVHLAEVIGPPEVPLVAARRLGAWQAETPIPQVPWLGGHQLAQRIAVTDLDFSAVDVPPRLRRIWDRREELLTAVETVPQVVCHGDFHVRNLIAGDAVTTVLDWGTFSAGPVGADLAHLALSCGEDLLDAYLEGLDGRFDRSLVTLGYRVTMALTAASRAHWMLSRGDHVPGHYLDVSV